MKNIIESFKNWGKGLTIQGRKIISNSLLCSKLYHCTAAFPLKLEDFSGIQKIIDNFTHKKKVMSGNRKYLPFSRAGLALPCLTSRHQAARLALLKISSFSKERTKQFQVGPLYSTKRSKNLD